MNHASFLIAFLWGFLGFLPTVLLAAPSEKKQLQELASAIKQSEEELLSQKQSLKNLMLSLESSEKELASHDAESRAIQNKLQNVRQQYKADWGELEALKKTIQANENDLLKLSEIFLRFKAKVPISSILSPENPAYRNEQLKILSHLQDEKAKKWQLLKEQQKKKETLHEHQLHLQAELNDLLKQHERSIADLKQEQTKRAVIMATLEATQITQEHRLEQLKQDESALKQLIHQKEKMKKEKPTFTAHRQWPFPVHAQPKPHPPGLIFPARLGTQVHAIAPGKIIFSSYFRRWGFLIIIDHGDGWMSLYAHNKNLLKKNGETVMQGEALALVGNSGGSAEPGLYFEIRHQGVPQNPLKYCQAKPMITPQG